MIANIKKAVEYRRYRKDALLVVDAGIVPVEGRDKPVSVVVADASTQPQVRDLMRVFETELPNSPQGVLWSYFVDHDLEQSEIFVELRYTSPVRCTVKLRFLLGDPAHYEALVNAWQYGNLGVAFDQSEEGHVCFIDTNAGADPGLAMLLHVHQRLMKEGY